MMAIRPTPVGVPAAGLEFGRAIREWASTETGVTVIGVTTGVAVGEWLGTMISEYFKLEAGWADIAGKAIGKGIFSFVLFVVGRRMVPGGLGRVFMNGAAVGSLASILGDVISQLVGPALGFGTSASSVKGITVKVNKASAPSIGATSRVITSV